MRNDRGPYIFLMIFAFLVLGGFYFVMSEVLAIKSTLKNLEFSIEQISKREAISTQSTPAVVEKQTTTEPAPPPKTDITIPTAIIFTQLSSSLLEPQTPITVTIEGVTRELDGTVIVGIKAYTNEAVSFSSLDVNQLFSIIDMTGTTQKPLFVNGSFNSIPAKNVASGGLVFKTDPVRATVILQVGTVENARFFEFNFSTKTYRETPLG